MIAVVGGPAKGQFGQVAGAHHQAVHPVSQIHEYLSAFPGLGVLIGDIVSPFVADIPQMEGYCLTHRDLRQCGTAGGGQRPGIAQGAPCGPEARHGHGLNFRPGTAQTVIGAAGHQQGQGGVQAAR